MSDTSTFAPARTDRLLIRSMAPDDAEPLAQRRSDPSTAAYQSWTVPFSLERAEQLVADVAALGGPTPDEWWSASVCDADTEAVLGDLAVHLSADGHTAEIGYTFAPAHRGRGYATEAAAWMVGHLFDEMGVTRVTARLDPDNVASARVAERIGLRFEGHTRSSTWVGDECSDDWIYGVTPDDWRSWHDRPRHRPDRVELVEITPDTVHAVGRLTTHKTQERFVASVRVSYGDALFPEVYDGGSMLPWLRAVVADGDLAGFVLLALTTPHHPEPYLWRLLVDRAHQGRGIGGQVLELVADVCRANGDTTLVTSWVPGHGSPEPFYLARGFLPTGEIVDDEVEARWTFE